MLLFGHRRDLSERCRTMCRVSGRFGKSGDLRTSRTSGSPKGRSLREGPEPRIKRQKSERRAVAERTTLVFSLFFPLAAASSIASCSRSSSRSSSSSSRSSSTRASSRERTPRRRSRAKRTHTARSDHVQAHRLAHGAQHDRRDRRPPGRRRGTFLRRARRDPRPRTVLSDR